MLDELAKARLSKSLHDLRKERNRLRIEAMDAYKVWDKKQDESYIADIAYRDAYTAYHKDKES